MSNGLIDMDIADIIMEKPYSFDVNDCRLHLYPTTLGKSYILSRLIASLGLNNIQFKSDEFTEILKVAKNKPVELCHILACYTFTRKEDLLDNVTLRMRAEFLNQNLTPEDMATLLCLAITREDITPALKHLGIDKEHSRQEKALAAKKHDNNTLTFGGKTVLGSLIIPACKTLNLTPEQVVWGISLPFLQLLMADNITQVYLTDEERKKAHISGGQIMDADNPANWDKIKNMKWD